MSTPLNRREAPVGMSKRRVVKSIGVILVLMACLVLALYGITWMTRYRPPVLSDFTEMTASFYDQKNSVAVRTFKVDKSCWSDMFSALSPWNDDYLPAEWKVLGALTIKTRDGKTHWVQLYDTVSEPLGAFSISHDSKNACRDYYRGGNSTELKRMLAKAYSKFQEEHNHAKPIEGAP
jgi:hypothetical protein